VLVADKYGRVHYEDDAGRVPVQDVVRQYCLRKEASDELTLVLGEENRNAWE
jgi:hypothetical protein